jgi:hypothetical protein
MVLWSVENNVSVVPGFVTLAVMSRGEAYERSAADQSLGGVIPVDGRFFCPYAPCVSFRVTAQLESMATIRRLVEKETNNEDHRIHSPKRGRAA